jgi:hypothetical protein
MQINNQRKLNHLIYTRISHSECFFVDQFFHISKSRKIISTSINYNKIFIRIMTLLNTYTHIWIHFKRKAIKSNDFSFSYTSWSSQLLAVYHRHLTYHIILLVDIRPWKKFSVMQGQARATSMWEYSIIKYGNIIRALDFDNLNIFYIFSHLFWKIYLVEIQIISLDFILTVLFVRQ